MDEEVKNQLKRNWRIISKRLLRVGIVVPLIVIIILAASVYQIKVEDGTFEEDDWSNTQYGASQYTSSVSIGTDGSMTTNMTAQELWDKLREENGRVNLYLDGPEELQKLMNAELVTQYLDTRGEDEIDDPIDWDKISDVNSNEVQGIIKLKRAQSDGTTITMTYKDPETFQSYIDAYNSSGSESDRNRALSYFTLEQSTIANGSATPIQAGETIYIPDGLGSSHTYMGWQQITATDSNQYKLREQAGMNFDEEGFGRINGRYVIACTTTFGEVGDYVDFYQADGTIIPCIIGDIKNQTDDGCTEWGHDNGLTVVEFVVDYDSWYNPDHVNPGTPNCHPEWHQNLIKAVNGGSYFDNPNFGEEDIKPNEDSDPGSGTSGSELYWPTDGTNVTSEFGPRTSTSSVVSSDHRGIDIGVSTGTNVYACEAGTVTTAGWSDSAGNWVVIDHGNGYVTKYMHNSELLVSAGDTVKKGQTIAKSGNTGNSTGPHLHFQIEYNGTAVDPLNFKYNNGMGSGTGGIGSSTGGSSNSTTTTYYAKVATWNQVTDTVESDDPDVESYSTTTYNMTTTNINYQEFVKGYTMPFDYLWVLLVMSEDQDFVLDLADLVLNSDIEITVHDNLSVNTNVNTYTYTENEKIISRDVRIVGNSQTNGLKIEYPADSSPHVNSVDRTVVHTVITTTNTLDISLTKANVWIVNYTKEYTYEVPEDIVSEGGAGALEDIAYTDEPDHTTQTDDIGYGESQRQLYHNQWVQASPDIVTTLERVYSDYYYSTTNRNESITNTLERNTYVEPPKADIIEKTNKNSNEPNFVTILLDGGNRKAKHAILGASEWLFDLLEKNENRIDPVMIDLTKYLLYKASGNEKYWDPDEPFDFSIFDPDNFASNDNGSSGIQGVPGQIYDYLLKKGVPPVGAAAILGNMDGETGGTFDTSLVNGTGHSGLCQWGGGRLQNLKRLANSKGKDWTDVEVQLDFLWQELNDSYSSVKDVIMSATQESDLEYATWYFGRYYEIYFTGTWPSSKNQSSARYERAQKWYEQYKQNSSSISGGGTIYYQDDYNVPYGTGTIADKGCGPTSFAMVASDYLGRQITPVDAIEWCGNTYYVANQGTSWAYFAAAANHFNLPCTVVDLGNNINSAIEQLRKGNLVINSQGPGIFTKGGHFIVLSSIDNNGGIKVRDPNKNNAINKGYENRTFTASEISAASSNYWAFVRN